MKAMKDPSSKQPPRVETWNDPVANAFRRWGYLGANLDPFGRIAREEHPDIVDAVADAPGEDVERWRRIYCGAIGVEFMHMVERDRQRWTAQWMESEHPVDILRFRRRLFSRYLVAARLGQQSIERPDSSLRRLLLLTPQLHACGHIG